MNQKNRDGMWLRPKNTEERDNEWALELVLASIVCVSFILSFTQLIEFNSIFTPWVMILASVLVCIAYGISRKTERQKLFYPCILALLAVVVLIGGSMLVNGFCITWNQMGDVFTANNGIVIPEFEAKNEASNNLGLLVFSVFFGTAVALMTCTIIGFKKTILAVLMPLTVFIAMVVFNKEYSLPYILFVLLVSVCLLLCEHNKELGQSLSSSLSRVLPVIVVGVLLVLTLTTETVADWADNVSQETRTKLHIAKYETEYTTLPEGKLADYSDSKDKSHVALIVSMMQPEPMYLRGFTGAVYEDGAWTALNTEILQENEELLYWMNQNSWNPNAQYESAVNLIADNSEEKIKNNTISVKNINACSKYLYMPYNLCHGEYLEPEHISSDGITSDGTRSYIYSVAAGGASKILSILDNLKTSESEEVQDYKKIENAYREFVYENYLQIPSDVEKNLLSKWEEHTAQYGSIVDMTSGEIQECAKAFLDTVEETGFEYATIATLTLRYYGIPARYAEGYIISQAMIDDAEDPTSITVYGTSQAAWVEVYQDGIGWIPSDVMKELNEEAIESMGQGNEQTPSQKPKPNNPLEEEAPMPDEEPLPEGGYMVTIEQNYPMIAGLTILAFILLILMFALRRILIINKRKKVLLEKSTKDAVATIFADAVKLLEILGFKRGTGSMLELVEPIKERLGDDFADEYKVMIDINNEALFSSHQMEDEKRTAAESFYDKTLKTLKDNAKWHKKLWMQWILCLY